MSKRSFSLIRYGMSIPETLERRKSWLEMVERGEMEQWRSDDDCFLLAGFKERNSTQFEKYKSFRLQNNPEQLLRVLQAINTRTRHRLYQSPMSCTRHSGEHDILMGQTGQIGTANNVGSKQVILPQARSRNRTPDRFNSAVLSLSRKQEATARDERT